MRDSVLLLLLFLVVTVADPNTIQGPKKTSSLSFHKLSMKQIHEQSVEGLDATWPFFFLLCMGVMIIMVYVAVCVIERREKRIHRANLERERQNVNRVTVPYLVLYDRRNSDLEARETML